MNATSRKDWREGFGVSGRKPPEFFHHKDDLEKVAASASQAHALRRAFETMKLDGIACLDGVPLIYFREMERIEADVVRVLLRQFWNQGIAPILVLISGDDVHVYSSLAPTVSNDEDVRNPECLVTTLIGAGCSQQNAPIHPMHWIGVDAFENQGVAPANKPPKATIPPRHSPPGSVPPMALSKAMPTIVNAKLDFELRNLDSKPPYLLNRGFTERTIAHFGLGYCSKGLFAGRVVIPLYDMAGVRIGYAGRIIFDDAIDDENPKYLFPPKRERNGTMLEFAKSLFVYNGHAIKPPVHDLYVVEGFPSVWWLWQDGFRDVVAVMGSSCSVDQARVIVDLVPPTGRVWILTDGDKAGERCAENLFFDVAPHRFCRWVKLRHGQPTDCNLRQLNELLTWKIEA